MNAAGGGAGVSAPVASSRDDSPSRKQSSSLSEPRGEPPLLRISTRTPSNPDDTARSTLASPEARSVPARRTRPGARSSTLMTAGEPSARVLLSFFYYCSEETRVGMEG